MTGEEEQGSCDGSTLRAKSFPGRTVPQYFCPVVTIKCSCHSCLVSSLNINFWGGYFFVCLSLGFSPSLSFPLFLICVSGYWPICILKGPFPSTLQPFSLPSGWLFHSLALLFIYCCGTNYPKLGGLKNNSNFSFCGPGFQARPNSQLNCGALSIEHLPTLQLAPWEWESFKVRESQQERQCQQNEVIVFCDEIT